MRDYIGLVLCTDGTVLRVPAFSQIQPEDMVIDEDRRIGRVVEMGLTINKNTAEYQFIQALAKHEIPKACAMMKRSVFEYGCEENDNG